MNLAGWGNSASASARVYRPDRVALLPALLADAPEARFIARGLGRSYGDAAVTDAAVANAAAILTTALDRFIALDESSGELEAEAGVSLDDIVRVALPRGFFIPITPGTRYVTLGGAIAADVHGKNHHIDGSFAACLIRFDLLLPDGSIVQCSRQQNTDLFFATLGGMGLTGIILTARLRLIPVETGFIVAQRQRMANLDALLDALAAETRDTPYSVAWLDLLAGGARRGRSVLIRGRHARADDLPAHERLTPLGPPPRPPRPFPRFVPAWALNRFTGRIFNARQHARQPDGQRVESVHEFFYPLDRLADWNRAYGRRGFVQYQAVLPHTSSANGLRALLAALHASPIPCYLAVLKTTGPESGGWLSFPIAGHTLAMDLPHRGPRLLQLLAEFDRIVLDHGGRVYLAKDQAMSADIFARMYPRLPEFQALRQRIDPHHRLGSAQSRRLGITP